MSRLNNFALRKQFLHLRQYRIVQSLYNLWNYPHLAYLKPLYEKAGLLRSHFAPIAHQNLKHLPSELPWLDEYDSSLVLKDQTAFWSLSKDHQNELKRWSQQGYVHLKGFFDEKMMDRMGQITEKLWDSSKGRWRFGDRRVLAAFQDEELWEFWNQKRLKGVVSLLLGDEAWLLNSINFMRGDDQPMHSDSYYMSTHPRGRLIGSWVALEDIHPDAGPLRYCPGSHRLPYIDNETLENTGDRWRVGSLPDSIYEKAVMSILVENRMEPKFHLPRKGDLFLWHANLIHGGSRVNDGQRTRKSMVAHFVSENVICYHENSQRPALKRTYNR